MDENQLPGSLYIQTDDFIQINDEFPVTHYFIYKNKQYPINFDYFKYSSNYFSKNQIEIKQNQNIQLVGKDDEEKLNFTEEAIKHFIGYVEHKKVPLNSENATTFHYLAKKYEISSLIKVTENYISNHFQEVALQILLLHQNDSNFDASIYEEIISEKLDIYINNDQLFSLNISVIYRIVSKFKEKQNQLNSEIIEFLFKCLDQYGREASILFSFVDIEKENSMYLNRLLINYSKIFDFHYINSSLMQSVYEMQNDLFVNQKREENYMQNISNEINELKSEMKKLNENHLIEIKKLKMEDDEKVDQLKNEIKRIGIEMNRMKDEFIQKMEVKNNKDEVIYQKLNEKTDQIIQQQINFKEEIQNHQKNEIAEIEKEIDQLKKNIAHIECSSHFESEINLDVFNNLNGENQKIILSELNSKNKNKENVNIIMNLLSFISNDCILSNKQLKNEKYIFIPLKETRLLNPKTKTNNKFKIGIHPNITEMLFANQSLNTKDFKSNINNFSEFSIEIKYPSQNFNNLYQKVLDLKQVYKDKLKIGIFISQIEATNQEFHNNQNINYARFDSCISKILGQDNCGPFSGCSSLTKVIIPYSVNEIGDHAFYECKSLTQINIPFSVISIGDFAFYGCSSLAEISIPSSVTSIGSSAFRKCSSLKQILIPSSVISIGEYAFKECTSLNIIVIPPSVTSIGFNSFG